MRSRILCIAAFVICSAGCQPCRRPGFYRGLRLRRRESKAKPLIWANGSVQYFTDQGNLSPILTGPQADAFVATAFSTWTSLAGVALTASSGGHLAEDVNGSNIETDGTDGHRSRRTLHLRPPALRSELFTTTTERSPMRYLGRVRETWRIASPTPSMAARIISPTSGNIVHALVVINGVCAATSAQLSGRAIPIGARAGAHARLGMVAGEP